MTNEEICTVINIVMPIQTLANPRIAIKERVYMFYSSCCTTEGGYCSVQPMLIGIMCGVTAEQVCQARKRLVADGLLLSRPIINKNYESCSRHEYGLPDQGDISAEVEEISMWIHNITE